MKIMLNQTETPTLDVSENAPGKVRPLPETESGDETQAFSPNWAADAPRGGRAVLTRVLKESATVPLFLARGQRMGRPPKLTPHQKREAIKRRDQGDETLADIGRSYNVSAATISRL
jgi:hypothetical protein